MVILNYAGSSGFNCLQNIVHGSQPIAVFNSLNKSVKLFGDLDIPNFYNKASVDILIADIYDDTYIKTEIDTLFSNIGLSNYYIKSKIDTLFSNIDLSNYCNKYEIDDIGNELSTLILNTYIKTEVDTQLTEYVTISYLQSNYMTTLSITEASNNNYASITILVDIFIFKLKLIHH